MKKLLTTLLFLTIMGFGFAQSLEHPVLYATEGERAQLLNKINTNAWAQDLVNSMKARVDSRITTHNRNPREVFSTVLDFPADDGNPESFGGPYARAHGEVLSAAAYSSMLYFVTEDEKYARFSSDILAYYFDKLGSRTEATTTITGNYFYDPRTCYNQLAVAYDFMYDYLKKPGTTVYNYSSRNRVSYNHTKAQRVMRNIAARTIHEAGGLETQGRTVSNHPILTAPGSIFSIFCIDNLTERERLFNLFWVRGTKRQSSFTKTILKTYSDQALWPEAVSYGFMPLTLLVINLVDRVKPELNAGADHIKLFESAALLENLRLPNRYFVRYGDSHRKNDGTGDINRYALSFAERRGYQSLKTQSEIALKQSFPASNGYSTSVPVAGFENFNALELFWGVPLPTGSVDKFDYKSTVIVEHAGVALQRNYSGVDDEENGLVGIIGGAHYVHSHVTGITMELYGAGDVMAPNGGLPPSLAERSTLPFQGYFNRYAGNNTVIVNGTSRGSNERGAWGSNKDLYQDRTVNIASEPKHLKNPISENFSFATQFLDDNVNGCDQQRTLSTIRTSETTAYYFDVFRSKANATNNFHDYVYHNIGDDTKMINPSNGQAFSLTNTNRYQNDAGDSYESPGWRLFEQTKTTAATLQPVHVRFDLNATNRYMHMLLPGGVRREYTKALGPASYEALNGYVNKKAQIIAIRQNGEAWDKPYVAVFEPSKNQNGSVQSIENLYTGAKIVGAKVVSVVDGKTITDYIISNENANDVYTSTEPAITFTGRFAIVREEDSQTTLYIGEGESLVYENTTLTSNARKSGLKIITGNQAPTVAITSPVDGARYELGEVIPFTASATDPNANLDRINFKVNNAYFVGDAERPFATTFTPTEIGTYKLAARAIDAEGLATEVFVNITITEVNLAPIASFVTPTVNTLEEGYSELIVTVEASDPNGDAFSVMLMINGQEVRSESVAPYEWGHAGSPNSMETVGLPVGDHLFEAVVTDEEGASTTISRTITVTERIITSITSTLDVRNLTAFPNPSESGIFTLSYPTDYEVHRINGGSVLTGRGDLIDLSAYPRGIYFLKADHKVIQLVR